MGDMSKIKTVCVYCGSGAGTNPQFLEAAVELGKALAENVHLRHGLNIDAGRVTHEAVAHDLGYAYVSAEAVLG